MSLYEFYKDQYKRTSYPLIDEHQFDELVAEIRAESAERVKELKCLALHAMCRWLDSWSICVGVNIMKHRKFGLFKQIKRHLNYYRQAYRKAKAELKGGK